jgi:hypothetical protein
MQVSAEIRWFWHDASPPGIEDWFCKADAHYCSAGGGGTRVDEYLRDASQVELGLKRRGGKKGVEVKGLVAVTWSGLAVGPFAGPVEVWTKWTSEPLELNSTSTVNTTKRRWLRKFDTIVPLPQEIPLDTEEKPLDNRPLPALGCNVELTQVSLLNGDVWWTLGFEAFGTIRTVENDLRAVATILAARRPPGLGDGLLASYPAWLKEHVKET